MLVPPIVARRVTSCEALNLSHRNPAQTLAAADVSMCPVNRSIARRLAQVTSVALIALLSYFLFPGHTYLQADTP
jgi:glycerol uptake facilitator-like aquaporin